MKSQKQQKSSKNTSNVGIWISIFVMLAILAIIFGLVFGLQPSHQDPVPYQPSPSPSISEYCQNCKTFAENTLSGCLNEVNPIDCMKTSIDSIKNNESCKKCEEFESCFNKVKSDCSGYVSDMNGFKSCFQKTMDKCLS